MDRPHPYAKDAELARAAWQRRFGAKRGMRRAFAAQHDVNESFVGLMLNGYTAISPTWKHRFAAYLGLQVTEIWPDADPVSAVAELFPPHIVELLQAAVAAEAERVRAATLLLRVGP
jgi:hypothetical protein